AILYELLTGRPPFKGTTVLETLEQVKTTEPVAPSRLVPGLPQDLETICLKCLQKEPVRRYADTTVLREDLRRDQAGEPILARRISGAERAWRWCRRNPVVAGLVATLLVVFAGGFAITTGLWLRAARLRAEAETNWRRAERLRAEAEDSFLQARRAVDDSLTRVAERRLLGVPGLEPLRQDLAETGLPYYQALGRRREQDPALRRELAAAYGRVARINAELGRRPQALEGYQKALDILATEAGRPGGEDPGLQAEQAQYHQAVGDVHR